MNCKNSGQNAVCDFSAGQSAQNELIAKFITILENTGKQHRIALMPDVHMKVDLESPSSAAIATKDAFSLKLTSPSPNCGMAMIRLPFTADELNHKQIIPDFFIKFCQHVPLNRKEAVLESEQVKAVLTSGAQAFPGMYNADPGFLRNYEFQGNIFNHTGQLSEDIDKIIPDFLIEMSRFRFGILGGGNHFLEFQELSEIYEPEVASHFNLEKGQAALLYHTGSEAVGSLIGRIYAQRKKTSRKMALRLLPLKLKFILSHYGVKNVNKYFSGSGLPFFSGDDPQSCHVLNAYHAAFNFGYANRFFILMKIKESLDSLLGRNIDLKLLLDISHNSIIPEKFENNTFWVHRHNSIRLAGQEELQDHPDFSKYGYPVIIPGSNRTATYMCIRGNNTEKSLHSVDHGLGNLLNFSGYKKQPQPVHRKTKMYNYVKSGYAEEELLDDTIIQETLRYLSREGIIKLVAKLVPIATLKGPKPQLN